MWTLLVTYGNHKTERVFVRTREDARKDKRAYLALNALPAPDYRCIRSVDIVKGYVSKS